jgi:hypothetical protein
MAMSITVPCSYWWQAREFYFGVGAHDCFGQSGFADELRAFRTAALACSQRSYTSDASNPLTGVHDFQWEEYNPTCALIDYEGDQFLFTLAEPRNAISSLSAYDSVTFGTGTEAVHEVSAYLGWASFAFHGSGNPGVGWEGGLDVHGLTCLMLRLIYQVRRTRTCRIAAK